MFHVVRDYYRGRRLSAVWYIHRNCNYNCPYCGIHNNKFVPYIMNERWIEAWNKISPDVIDITGGEPFMQPDFVNLVDNLPGKIGVTTNLTYPPDFPENVHWVTCSLHPSQRTFDFNTFIKRVTAVRDMGIDTTVNFVAYPQQMELIPNYKALFEGLRVKFHVDPYRCDGFYYDKNQKEFLKQYVKEDRSHYLSEDERYDVDCSAGINHLVVMDDGGAYKCLIDYFEGRAPFGNILEDFEMLKEPCRCSDYYRCIGCNYDKVVVKRV